MANVSHTESVVVQPHLISELHNSRQFSVYTKFQTRPIARFSKNKKEYSWWKPVHLTPSQMPLLRFLILSDLPQFPSNRAVRSLLLDRAADAGTDDTGQLLTAHGEDATDGEAHNEDQTHGEQSDKPECDAHVLLLARRATPDGCLDLAIATVFLGGRALAAVAVTTLLRVAVVVKLAALAMASAVAGDLLALFLRAEASGQDATKRCTLVRLGEAGQGSGHRSGFGSLRGGFEGLGQWLLDLTLAQRGSGSRHGVGAPARGVGASGGHEDNGHRRQERMFEEHFNALQREAQDERVVASKDIDGVAGSELIFNLTPAIDAVASLNR